MQVSITTYAATPSSLTLADGTTGGVFSLVAASIDWGNATYSHSYSGPRGTQGARPAAGVAQNRTVTLPIRVYGSTVSTTAKDGLAASLKTLNQTVDELRRYGGRLTWQSLGQTYRQNLEILGTDGTSLSGWTNRTESKGIAEISVSLVCAPYATGDPFDIDDQSFSSLSDYTFDNGLVANLTNAAAKLKSTGTSPLVEYRAVQTQRGYNYGDVEVTVKAAYSQTDTYKAGAIFWRTDAANYWTVHVVDASAGSNLQIHQVTAGTITQRATVAIAARIASAAVFYVRARTEGALVTAEYWTAAPTPLGTPTNTTSYTATASSGKTGVVFTPGTTTSEIDALTIRPFTYAKATLPRKLSLSGTIPGDATALANVELTTAQDAAWAMFGWAQTASSTLSSTPTPRAPFWLWNGNDDDSATRSGWTTSATGTYQGFLWNNGVWSSATTYSARYILDPSLLPTDPYVDGDRAVEVWALVLTDRSDYLVSPNIVASLQSKDGYGLTRYTDEWGTAGKSIPTLATTASGYGFRWTRLGTIHLGNAPAREMALKLTGTAASTSNAAARFGIARVAVLPIKQRAALPTYKHAADQGADSSYPKWSSTSSSPWSVTSSYLTGALVTYASAVTQAIGSANGIYRAKSTVIPISTTATGTSGTPTITVSSATGLSASYFFASGAGIPANTTITAVAGTTITLSQNLTADLSSTAVTFVKFPGQTAAWEAFEQTRVVSSDLTSQSWQPTANTAALNDRSIGGSLVEIPNGNVDLLAVLSKVVPDDPNSSTISEGDYAGSGNAVAYQGAIHLSVTPRFDHLRTVS